MAQFRRSIWEQSQRYRTKYLGIDPDLIPVIDVIQSVEAAKKRTPPIPLNALIKIAELSKSLPDPSNVSVGQFKRLLDDLDCYGAGVKTVIAVIARVSGGKYPPIDEKIAAGLHVMGIITEGEEASLNGSSHVRIAGVYVNKIVPKWREELASGKSPKQIDEEWARRGDRLRRGS